MDEGGKEAENKRGVVTKGDEDEGVMVQFDWAREARRYERVVVLG